MEDQAPEQVMNFIPGPQCPTVLRAKMSTTGCFRPMSPGSTYSAKSLPGHLRGAAAGTSVKFGTRSAARAEKGRPRARPQGPGSLAGPPRGEKPGRARRARRPAPFTGSARQAGAQAHLRPRRRPPLATRAPRARPRTTRPLHTHRQLQRPVAGCHRHVGIRVGELPVFHVAGLLRHLPAEWRGGSGEHFRRRGGEVRLAGATRAPPRGGLACGFGGPRRGVGVLADQSASPLQTTHLTYSGNTNPLFPSTVARFL